MLGIVLHRTWIGRQTYAIGRNAGTARFSGVRVARLRIGLFVLSGTIAALAGVILTSRLSSARADAGSGMTITAVTVVLLGGANIFGGSGTIPGIVLAVLTVAVMQNALRLASVSVEVQSIALGLLLILSVVIPTFAHQAKSAIDRVRRGRHPPADSIPMVSRRCRRHRGGTDLKLSICRAMGRPRRHRGHSCSSACSSGSTAAPSAATAAPTAAPAGDVTVGYLPKDIVNQYFAAAKTGVDKAAARARRQGHPGRAERGQGGPPDPVHHRPHHPGGQRDHHLGRRQG